MPIGLDTRVYRRKLPHLEKLHKTYFFTFITRNRSALPPSARDIVLACCVHDHEKTYWLHCVVVMPDHVHMLFTAYEGFLLAMIANRIKRTSAHRINALLGRTGPVWQREYFDRILRSDEDVRKKAEYICDNPVRAGLVARSDEYPWIWREWVEGRCPQRP